MLEALGVSDIPHVAAYFNKLERLEAANSGETNLDLGKRILQKGMASKKSKPVRVVTEVMA